MRMIAPVYLSALVVGAWRFFGSMMFNRTCSLTWMKMQIPHCLSRIEKMRLYRVVDDRINLLRRLAFRTLEGDYDFQ